MKYLSVKHQKAHEIFQDLMKKSMNEKYQYNLFENAHHPIKSVAEAEKNNNCVFPHFMAANFHGAFKLFLFHQRVLHGDNGKIMEIHSKIENFCTDVTKKFQG